MTVLVHPVALEQQGSPQDPLVVRRATPDDAHNLHRIVSQPAVLENTGMEPLLSPEQLRAWIMDLGPESYLLVACVGPELRGGLLLQPATYPGRRHAGELLRMVVDSDHHGRGVGTRLMEAALNLADNWFNLYRLELLVRADNSAAIGLYTKFGFYEEARLRNYGYRNGAFMDLLLMVRMRGPLDE